MGDMLPLLIVMAVVIVAAFTSVYIFDRLVQRELREEDEEREEREYENGYLT